VKLATIENGSRDGRLVVVSKDLKRYAPVDDVAPTLQHALENWPRVHAALDGRYQGLCAGGGGDAFSAAAVMAPLPRAYQWLDASAFKSHGFLMSKAFNREPHKVTFPLMYQGGSDSFLGPHSDIVLPREEDGIDFEAEIGIITDCVPMGTKAADAEGHIRLFVLINDVSLRFIAPVEMATGFGWIQAKPSSSFAPVAITPGELGDSLRDSRVHLPVEAALNGQPFGRPHAGEMAFGFAQLIEHAAATRSLCAGTIIGSGTISNHNYNEVGSACIAERRAIEMIAHGEPKTDYMRFGDRVRIEMRDAAGEPLFGAIDQMAVRHKHKSASGGTPA
jgi:fumarylacetoacetate (FAA) hydrolase